MMSERVGRSQRRPVLSFVVLRRCLLYPRRSHPLRVFHVFVFSLCRFRAFAHFALSRRKDRSAFRDAVSPPADHRLGTALTGTVCCFLCRPARRARGTCDERTNRPRWREETWTRAAVAGTWGGAADRAGGGG